MEIPPPYSDCSVCSAERYEPQAIAWVLVAKQTLVSGTTSLQNVQTYKRQYRRQDAITSHRYIQIASGLPSLEGHLVNFCLASKEDEHIPSGFIQVDVHGSVHSCCQVVLCMVLLAVHYLNLKGTPWHSEDGAVIEVGAELLPIQGG